MRPVDSILSYVAYTEKGRDERGLHEEGCIPVYYTASSVSGQDEPNRAL